MQSQQLLFALQCRRTFAFKIVFSKLFVKMEHIVKIYSCRCMESRNVVHSIVFIHDVSHISRTLTGYKPRSLSLKPLRTILSLLVFTHASRLGSHYLGGAKFVSLDNYLCYQPLIFAFFRSDLKLLLQTESRLFFVIEFVPGGDLMFHMQRQRKLPEDHARYAVFVDFR